GLAAELGLEYEQLAPRYPRLVVGTVTAFGPHGPDAARAGMDHVVQARSGLMVTGGRTKDGLPTSGESPIADYMAAALLAFGVTSALYRRERTGRGGRVDTSLAVACGSPSLRRKFIVAVGHEDPALTGSVPDVNAHYAALKPAVEATLASRTTAEWQAHLDAHGVPASGVSLPIEMLDDPQ